MSAKNCPLCGKIFDDNRGFDSVCGACKPTFDIEFDNVREVLYEHPEYNIVQVSEITGVSVQRLKLYLREGRLVAINNSSASLLSCLDCGKAIESGQYCSVCEYKHRSSAPTGIYVGGKASTKMHSRDTREDRKK